MYAAMILAENRQARNFCSHHADRFSGAGRWGRPAGTLFASSTYDLAWVLVAGIQRENGPTSIPSNCFVVNLASLASLPVSGR
jgi:hypothetical protein